MTGGPVSSPTSRDRRLGERFTRLHVPSGMKPGAAVLAVRDHQDPAVVLDDSGGGHVTGPLVPRGHVDGVGEQPGERIEVAGLLGVAGEIAVNNRANVGGRNRHAIPPRGPTMVPAARSMPLSASWQRRSMILSFGYDLREQRAPAKRGLARPALPAGYDR